MLLKKKKKKKKKKKRGTKIKEMVFPENSFIGPKRSTLLFVLVTASLLSASFAGGHCKLIVDSQVQVETVMEESLKKANCGKAFVAHPRILTVKTNDYGSYDPSPSLAKPPFKLIPN